MKKLIFKNYTTDNIGIMDARYDVFTKDGTFVGAVYQFNNKWYCADVDGIMYDNVNPLYYRQSAAEHTRYKFYNP